MPSNHVSPLAKRTPQGAGLPLAGRPQVSFEKRPAGERRPYTLLHRYGFGRTLLALILFPFVASAADAWAPNLTLTSAWDDNATNANLPSDRIGALQTAGDLVASERFAFGRNDSIHPTVRVAGIWWPRFSGLLQGSVGARLEWRHKFGLGAMAPVASVEFALDEVAAKENGRRGTSSGVTLALRKRLNEVLRATLTQEWAEHAARLAPFDRRGAETALAVDREITDVARLTFRVSYRDGDVLSYGTPPRPDLVALAPNRMPVTTFGPTMVAYSVEARTIAFRGTVTRALDESSAVIVGYEWRDTKRTPLNYVNHLVSVALVHQF